jgi:hypothetical protein
MRAFADEKFRIKPTDLPQKMIHLRFINHIFVVPNNAVVYKKNSLRNPDGMSCQVPTLFKRLTDGSPARMRSPPNGSGVAFVTMFYGRCDIHHNVLF